MIVSSIGIEHVSLKSIKKNEFKKLIFYSEIITDNFICKNDFQNKINLYIFFINNNIYMDNSNEEDFNKKYLKYKAKYLELKDLLEGGIPPKNNIP